MAPVSLRPPARDDIPAIHSVVRASETHDSVPLVTSLEEVAEGFDDRWFDPERHGRVVEAGGEIVAWGRVLHRPSGERLERAHVLGTVHPDWRRQGIGGVLLRWQIDTAREILEERPPGLPRYIRTLEFETVTDAVRLYERHGMRPVRWFEDLRRPLSDLPPVSVPEGIALVPWDRSRDEAALDVRNEAFADHWGSIDADRASWAAWLGEHGVRLDLSLLALAGDRVVGYALNSHYPADEAVTGRRDGWVDGLGVVRDWRRRGVASALIARSLQAFAEAGFTHAMIGVDSENPSGAAGLYRRLGFVLAQRSVTHEIALPTS